MLSELRDYFRIAIRFQKRGRERQPLSGRQRSNQIEQENEQVVRLRRERGQRFLVIDFEIDQAHAIVARIINNVGAAGIPCDQRP